MRKRLIICSFFLLQALLACTLTPRDTGKAFMFALSPVKTSPSVSLGGSLVVALPVAAPELDTYRIALKNKAKWDYYAGARWAGFLPSLVQDNLTKTLEDAGLFKTVTTDESGLVGDWILKASIRTFQAEYEQGSEAPVVKVRLVANLVSRFERTPVASFEVRAEKVAAKDRLPEIQAAFDDAFREVQKQLLGRLKQRQE